MGDSIDPFATPQPLPQGPPPPQGPPIMQQTHAAPAAMAPPPYPGAPQYAPAYPVPYGSPYAMPYGAYAPPAWKRSWRTTMGRWGIGFGVAFITSLTLGLVAGIGQGTAEAGGEVAGTLAAGTWMYMLLIPWWLDHIVAGLGKAGAWAIHGGVSLLLAFLNFAYLSLVAGTPELDTHVGVGSWMVLVMWAVAYGLGMLFADMLRTSYRPKSG